ncbi:MAG: (d)CMP kinase [Synergistales bacterium]|nr:(d)CMP kinase [Synergistales bacterium]
MKKNPVITIDGPSGAGKSTVARLLAARLGIRYLDSGAIYRAVAYVLDKNGVPPEDGAELREALAKLTIHMEDAFITVNGKDVTDKIRTPYVSAIASKYSSLPVVRQSLLMIQRQQAGESGLVAEGRDMGTVIFPDADVKFYLIANDKVRAERRWKELREKGQEVELDFIMGQIQKRDNSDSSRKTAPLKAAEDSVIFDTSELNIQEVIEGLAEIIRSRTG